MAGGLGARIGFTILAPGNVTIRLSGGSRHLSTGALDPGASERSAPLSPRLTCPRSDGP
ncbi:hypothetical protein SBA6_280001 [Candidatus Sulfopaludibacter sp. SbA6]|nr:hypothetical protein SBA6_280001 [Candidatus Sulfopaludibacter sp. SbA6]